MLSLYALVVGFILDLFFGDPPWFPHPVRLIGWLIGRLEKLLRLLLPKTKGGELVAGGMLAVLLCVTVPLVVWLLLWAASLVSVYLRFALESLMCYQVMAMKSLKVESMKVYRQVKRQNLHRAQKAVSYIVGRDTQRLDMAGVIRAAIESVAENTSDGVIAPMFFLALGGPVLGFFYKTVNTLDSMVGYRNEKYFYFGWVSAKLDDVLNYFPARASAYAMILAAHLLKLDSQHAYHIFVRDRHRHASPNSAQTESVCAGALHIQLAGNAWYAGRLVKKPTIGDDDRPVEAEDIKRANDLMYCTGILCFALCFMVKLAFLFDMMQ